MTIAAHCRQMGMLRVLRDQLKVVVGGNVDRINHRSINDLANSFPKALGLVLHERDANKRHCESPSDADMGPHIVWSDGVIS
jgi:hypothetical protein